MTAEEFGIWGPECSLCHGEGEIEEAVFGRFAAESRRTIPCPRCRHHAYEDDQRDYTRRLAVASRDTERKGLWL